MKQTINFYQFRKWFEQNRPNNFSYQGLQALWEMLEDYEQSTDHELEFDPISLCIEYTEYDNIAEFWLDYNQDEYPDEDAIMDATFYWAIDNESFIIQNF